MEIEYIGITAPHEIGYDFEVMTTQSGSPLTTFLVNEMTVMNRGLQKCQSLYLLEEIVNRPGVLRVTQMCLVQSETEARSKLKRLISLKTMLGHIDRKGAPVGNLAEITIRAKAIADGDIVEVSEEDDDSYNDNGIESVNGEIEPTEAGDTPHLIEEAKNTRVYEIEEEKQTEAITEDLTTPSAILGFDEIEDWEDRMTRANYTSEQRDFIRQAHTKKEEWLNFCASSDWKVTDDNKKDGI